MNDEPERFVVHDRRRVDTGEIACVTDTPPPAPPTEFMHLDGANGHQATVPGGIIEAPSKIGAAEFARVVDELRAGYRPGVPDDEVPTVWHLAHCPVCAIAGGFPRRFDRQWDRDQWAAVHADNYGHTVTLALQHAGGTTLVGEAAPDPAAEAAPPPVARGTARPPGRVLPLLAFVVPEGGPPDMICRIPNRAGAAWLAHAAHSCLLGQGGSAGVAEPHRVMYIGRVSQAEQVWRIRIDGLVGATGKSHGEPVGDEYGVSVHADLPTIEDAVESMIDDEYHLGRHTFSVVLVADVPPADPPDPEADAALREQRRAARDDTGEQVLVRPGTNGVCCDMHNAQCEPPADLCCADCTEVAHPAHPYGARCVLTPPAQPD